MSKNNVIQLADQIRLNGRQMGYEARMGDTYITNPFVPTSNFYDVWNDGYDLGIRDANLEMFLAYRETLSENFA